MEKKKTCSNFWKFLFFNLLDNVVVAAMDIFGVSFRDFVKGSYSDGKIETKLG
jgi:uncharacterized protein YpmS